MKICKNCGTQLTDDALFCNSCGTKVEEETTTENVEPTNQEAIGLYQQQSPQPVPQQPIQQPMPQQEQVNFRELASQAGSSISALASGTARTIGNKMNETRSNFNQSTTIVSTSTLALADGETAIKEYAVTRIKSLFSKMSGRLLVTNKRLIFYAGSTQDRIVLSTPVNTVGSINFISGNHVQKIRFIIGCIFLLAGLAAMSNKNGGFMIILGLILLAIGGFLMWSSIKKSMFLCISSENSTPSMTIGKSNTVSSSSYVIDGESDVDADVFMNEIGALVLDLQQMGDLAIQKWKVN